MSSRPVVLSIRGSGEEPLLSNHSDVAVTVVDDHADAADHLATDPVDCVVCANERDGLSGLELLGRLRSAYPHIPSILLTDEPSDEVAAAVADGTASEYLPLAIWRDPASRLAERVTLLSQEQDPTRPDERTLSGLLATARQLLTIHSPDEIADVVIDAAVGTLDFEWTTVWLVDDHDERLTPATGGDDPAYEVGEPPVGRVFETGQPTVQRRDEDAALYFPLGDHGVLAVGTGSVTDIEESDVQLAEILTANASAAFERAAREETLELYRTVVDNVREMVYVLDETARIVLVSRQIVEATGYDRDELVGEHVSKFIDEGGFRRGGELVAELFAAGDDGSRTYRTTGLRADGTDVPIEIELSLLPSDDGEFRGTIGAVRDISDLVETEERLAHERDRFRSLFEHLPDPVVDARFEGDEPIVDTVNPAFERVFGHETGAVVGQSVNDVLVPADDEDTGRELDRRTLAEGDDPVSAEVRRETADGDRYFLFRGIPYRTDDRGTHAFGIYTDISDQRDRERHLQVLHRVLRHNLRTDMGVVIGYLDQLDDRLDDPDDHALIERVTGRAEDVARLADKVHQLEQVIQRDTDLTPGPTDVVARLEPLADGLRDRYPGATIDVEAPETAMAHADERLDLAVENLVENGIQHTHAPEPTVGVRVETDADGVDIHVTDDGPGIPAHERAFLTGDRDVSQVEHGDGLGLWVVNWVVRSLGGEVTFGDPDVGTEVVVHLRPA
ncbi:PAS domain S-box protein [Haloarchaeobius litoreus]|uniref:histidine kinase n=1 Tax=Haloarchaeobius litoreus TaxID=755306 RepID=A0ABD6DD79_9EURY|nr:PAS domain S-box protein [Haloarchaeobius litoreus]